MLKRLAISNYALIDTLDISFSKGLNILTGETGAGKSIILGALSLILGQRAESKYFFNQQKKCVIEGTFSVSGFHLQSFFEEMDLDYESDTVLRREISADGKTRSFINDTPVNLATLKKLGERLIDIHSQHATLEINDEDFQLLVLDTVAGNATLLSDYQGNYKHYRQTQLKLNELISRSEKSQADLDYFQFQFDELDKVQLQADEQINLEQEVNILSNAEEIKRSLLAAIGILGDQESAVVTQLKEASNTLGNCEKFNPEIAELNNRLASTLIEVKDILSEIERIEQHMSVDEARLEEVSNRLDTLYSLQKKHRVTTVPELIDLRDGFSEKLNSILFAEEDISKVRQELDTILGNLTSLGQKLHESRVANVSRVEDSVIKTLNQVGMPNAVLKIDHERLETGRFELSGTDQIKFLFSANKGQAPLPMNKVASGGELSRLMLSIKSLIAVHTALPTIIFDEIDTGISGEVAFKVGKIMEQLSESMQVIAITHLPQIAARGEAHYTVYKDEQTESTHTNIRLINHEQRVQEIAKMLSGDNPGEPAILNARELLK